MNFSDNTKIPENSISIQELKEKIISMIKIQKERSIPTGTYFEACGDILNNNALLDEMVIQLSQQGILYSVISDDDLLNRVGVYIVNFIYNRRLKKN